MLPVASNHTFHDCTLLLVPVTVTNHLLLKSLTCSMLIIGLLLSLIQLLLMHFSEENQTLMQETK